MDRTPKPGRVRQKRSLSRTRSRIRWRSCSKAASPCGSRVTPSSPRSCSKTTSKAGKDWRSISVANRFLVGAALALVTFITGNTAYAQDYPTRPITAVIPFAGGSASDVVSRILFDKMSKSLGQPIVVENRPGAGGNIGTADVARAAPDGYTILGGGSGPVAANVTLYKQLDYDPEKDFETVSPFASFTIVVAASV